MLPTWLLALSACLVSPSSSSCALRPSQHLVSILQTSVQINTASWKDTHRATLQHTHTHTLTRKHSDLKSSINKPPTALFQSLETDRESVCVCVCWCVSVLLSKTNKKIYKTISDIALLSLGMHSFEHLSSHYLSAQRDPFSETTRTCITLCLTHTRLQMQKWVEIPTDWVHKSN